MSQVLEMCLSVLLSTLLCLMVTCHGLPADQGDKKERVYRTVAGCRTGATSR